MTNRSPDSVRGTPHLGSARRIAFDVLVAVERDDAYANLLLPTRLDRAKLSPADTGFATELTYGTLRMQGFYDVVIGLAASRDAREIDLETLVILRLGAHQLLTLLSQPYAVVHEQVELANVVLPRARGFVNAILRRISERSTETWRHWITETAVDARLLLSELTSHPEWIIDAFEASLAAEGREFELDALLAADNTNPKLNVIALPGLAVHPVDSEADLPDDSEPNQYSPYGFTTSHAMGVVRGSEGLYRMQDEGSQLAALALVCARAATPGERWLDLCAGPGGKAAILAAEAQLAGSILDVNEVSESRAMLVRSALAGVPGEVRVRVGDGRTFKAAEQGVPNGYDRILLDAPCTGLGALRRRPEARWRKHPEDVEELALLQTELFDAAVGALAPNGLLAYVTCSPHLAETRDIVSSALLRHGRLRPLDTVAILNEASLTPLDLVPGFLGTGERAGSSAQLWPHRHRTDAMFISLLQLQ